MVPRQRKTHTPNVNSESEGEAPGYTTNDDAIRAAQNIVNMNKRRRETKRVAIEREHQKRCKDLKVRIENVYAVRKNKATKSRQVLYERLEALNHRREALEKIILVSAKQIELQTKNMCSEVVAMLQGRLEELSELPSGSSAVV